MILSPVSGEGRGCGFFEAGSILINLPDFSSLWGGTINPVTPVAHGKREGQRPFLHAVKKWVVMPGGVTPVTPREV